MKDIMEFPWDKQDTKASKKNRTKSIDDEKRKDLMN
jgi:hypothetical protein